MSAKFNIGDRVRIVNYGGWQWINKKDYAKDKASFDAIWRAVEWKGLTGEDVEFTVNFNTYDKPDHIISDQDTYWICDTHHNIVGKNGIIIKHEIVQGISHYAIDGIPEKCSWYNEDQLELV